MKTISISVKERSDLGKKFTKELRKIEHVPCVLYGGTDVLHFHAHENNFRHLVYTPDVFVVELDIDGDKRKAIMQELQFHPVTDKILHIDFIEAFDDKPVIMNIPVEMQGIAIGLKQGGKPRLKRRTLRVKGIAAKLPDRLVIDIANVDVGDVIKVGDLDYPDLELLDPHRSMIFAIVSSRLAMKGMELEDPDAVAEETEAVEGEEGAEAPAEGDAEAEEKSED
ncbi:MAG: 50S ribosomal protein L25/general stress protein Ctc [Bacteroidales bacterium]|jgi:large subunit ribosomal protein L25|nr:50S ribosomal protein L25/general stress protein Ctc [Bacteroidales bacterium]